MILNVFMWLPCKLVRHYLAPVTDMLDRLAMATNQQIDDYIKENPL